jgi:hypothetical protein
MKVDFDDSKFFRELTNITKYAEGFLEGAITGKKEFLDNLGSSVIESLKNFIDMNARVDPQSLHHVYEWQQVGQETGRLFDLNYVATSGGISVNGTLKQSQSVAFGANTPFYDKAKIMESGMPITIRPRYSEVLAFEENGEKIFTKKDVHIDRPGGASVQGSFERVFDTFFSTYFSQSFLSSSGLRKYLENPIAFKNNLNAGKTGGKSVGKQIGYNWIVKAGGMV